MDPKIVVTTSRDPSSKLLQFTKVCALSMAMCLSMEELIYCAMYTGDEASVSELTSDKQRKLCREGAG